jgi:DNA ligase 1
LRFAVHPPGVIATTACAFAIAETVCAGREHLAEFYADVLARGGEGVMLRMGGIVVKVKPEADEEAEVVGIAPRTGSLIVGNARGVFKLTLPLRPEPPPRLGSLVTYRFNGETARGLPRHARLMRERPAETLRAA